MRRVNFLASPAGGRPEGWRLQGGVAAGLLLLSGILLTGRVAPAQEDPHEPGRAAAQAPLVLRMVVSGPIDGRRAEHVKAKTRGWLEDRPAIQFVVFEIDSTGGEPEAARDLADFLADDLKSVTTVAFIPEGKFALEEAALVAMAAKSIVMGKDSRLGADKSRRDRDEKEEARLREWMRSHARERGYPTSLTDAMVSKRHDEVLAVRIAEQGGRAERIDFKTRRDFETLGPEQKLLVRGEPRIVAPTGERLILGETEALEYRIARHVANDLTGLQQAMNIFVGPESVIDGDHGAMRSSSPGGQAVIDFLNSPAARFFLLLIGCLALLIELKAFGTMVPGVIALICFAIFFASSALPVSGSIEGTASLWEISLFLIGLALICVEFFLLPGMAIFAISGAALAAISLVLAMVPGADSATEAHLDFEDAISILAFGFGTGSVGFLVLLRYLPHNPIFARRGLVSHAAIVGVPTADSLLAAQAEEQKILGVEGTAMTTLRPAGKVALPDGRILDVVAGGDFIEQGTRVKVIGSDGGIIVVARLEA